MMVSGGRLGIALGLIVGVRGAWNVRLWWCCGSLRWLRLGPLIPMIVFVRWDVPMVKVGWLWFDRDVVSLSCL